MKTKQKEVTSEDVYDYVIQHCQCHQESKGVYLASIRICGIKHEEFGASYTEAHAKLANELSKSIYIRKNIILDDKH